MPLDRREFLKAGLTVAGAATLRLGLWERLFAAPAAPGVGPYGPLNPPDANGLMLPDGFSSRVIARAGLPVLPSAYLWPVWPDGAYSFPAEDGGWIHVVNSEFPVGADIPFLDAAQRLGCVSAIRFAADGSIVEAYRILDGTRTNCAGGATPWGTWLSCEEFDESIRGGPTANAGKVWECDPAGATPGRVLPALGAFKHEAAAVDPETNQVYMTEDVPDGRFYRFTPSSFTGTGADLEDGTLEAARLTESGDGWDVAWVEIPDPTAATTRTRAQAPTTTPFDGGEGCFYDSGIVYFTTKGDDRVWRYHVADERVTLLYDAADPQNQPDPLLKGVDNVIVSGFGDVYVAEDGDNMEIVVITPGNEVAVVMRAPGPEHGFADNPLPSPLGSIPLRSEVTGLAFSPDGTRLYFNSQRGLGIGVTYEVTGPFRS